MFEVEQQEITTDQGQRHLQYKISGSIDIASIARLKELILEAFQQRDHLVLDWYGVEEVDFTALQLMCAVNVYAAAHGKTFELRNRFIPPVLASIKRLGFIRETGCAKEHRKDCLWVMPEAG